MVTVKLNIASKTVDVACGLGIEVIVYFFGASLSCYQRVFCFLFSMTSAVDLNARGSLECTMTVDRNK